MRLSGGSELGAKIGRNGYELAVGTLRCENNIPNTKVVFNCVRMRLSGGSELSAKIGRNGHESVEATLKRQNNTFHRDQLLVRHKDSSAEMARNGRERR